MSAKTRGSPTRKGRRGHAKAISGNPFQALLADIKQDVDARLQGLLDSKLDAVRKYGPEVVKLCSATHDLCLRGGKRLRPALVVAGYRAATGKPDLDTAIDLGVALELLHGYLLIHDDWMDDDAVRRGGPAVHAHLAVQFRSEKLGHAAGILAGDYAAGLAVEALSRAELPAARVSRLLATFAQMQIDAVLGQQLDLMGRPESVDLMYRLKTASYTVRGPLQLGAILGNASVRVLTALDRFALPVGVAFQHRDDLIGVFADPRATGKPRGSDLRGGKPTVLVQLGLERAKGKDRKLLQRVLGNARCTDEDLAAASDVLDRCGARRAVEARITELVRSARVALAAGRLDPEAQRLLEGAARALTERDS
jgi:geranylgeranyl diphosphate synthase, type I